MSAGSSLRRRREFLTDRRKRVSRMAHGQFPAVTNESRTIDSDRVAADRLVSAATFLRRVNIAAGFPREDSSGKTFRAVVSAPFVGDADILRAREPAFTQRIAVAAVAIGRVNLNAAPIFSVSHIFRGRQPAMLDKGLSNLERLRPGERLGRAELRPGHQPHQQDDQ